MPMNTMMSSINKYETPNVRNFYNMQGSVSSFYSSVSDSQHVGAPPVIPMDVGIGHATTSYLDGYSQTSYATPHVTDFSAPYATSDIHYSAPHLHNGYSRLSGTSIGANVPSSSIVAYGTSPSQLQSFGNRSLPKETKSIVEQSYAGLDDLKEKLLSNFNEFEATHRREERGDRLAVASRRRLWI